VKQLKRERGGLIKKRQLASGKGVPRGPRVTQGDAAPEQGDGQGDGQGEWLDLKGTLKILGVSLASLKMARGRGDVVCRKTPGRSGAMIPWQYQRASVVAYRDRREQR
jgi:hypothetical protein